MKKFKVGVIGLGRQASEDHIPAVLNSDLVELRAVCDIDLKKLEEYKEKLRVKGYSSSIKLLH